MVFVNWRLCVNICMTNHRCQHNSTIKNDKKHIRHFCFYQKKSAADAHKNIYETYDENVIVIRRCANWFKRFKIGDFDISDKERSAAVEKDELRKDGKKWKTIENFDYLFILYRFFLLYFNKKLQKIGKNLT